MSSQAQKSVPVEAGTVLTFDVLTWHEPAWEFDHPTVILRPVVQYSPNGDSVEDMIESACEQAAGYMHIDDDPEVRTTGMVDRSFPLARLKRRFAEALRGEEFPVLQYEAERVTVRFYHDAADECLAWEIVE